MLEFTGASPGGREPGEVRDVALGTRSTFILHQSISGPSKKDILIISRCARNMHDKWQTSEKGDVTAPCS